MGKVRVAQLLARAGLHLSASTVKRMGSCRLCPQPPSAEDCADGDAARPQGRLRSPDPPAASVRDGAASATADRAGSDDANTSTSAGAPDGANGPGATNVALASANASQAEPRRAKRRVRADYSDHVWNTDLSVVPTCGGFWTTWLPFSLAQCWPFAWWVVAVVDHYSRQIMALEAYFSQPSEAEVCALLDWAVASAGRAPRYTVTDQGGQFGDGYRAWCRSHDVRPRFGAIGESGSIALIERFMRALKDECTRRLLVPLRLADFRTELSLFATWYGSHRPHQSLGGRTPSEVYEAGRVVPFFATGAQHATAANDSTPGAWDVEVLPANDAASPAGRASPAGLPKLALEVTFLEGRRHLPIVKLRRAA
jgi:transposase InsO family protein